MEDLHRRFVLGLLAVTIACAFSARLSAAAERLSLAIRGYDPVAYFTLGKPVLGLSEIEYKWDEQTYRFSTTEHRELFKANPFRYAPEFGNFCAMALTRGEVEEANPEYWLVRDGKLFLFGKPIGPARFQESLSDNLRKSDQNRVLIHKP